MKSPAVYAGIRTDALDSDVLAGLHPCHKAVVTFETAEISGVVGSQSVRCGDISDYADNKRSAVLSEFPDYIAVCVDYCTAVGGLSSANVLTCGIEDVAYACYGCTVLGGD